RCHGVDWYFFLFDFTLFVVPPLGVGIAAAAGSHAQRESMVGSTSTRGYRRAGCRASVICDDACLCFALRRHSYLDWHCLPAPRCLQQPRRLSVYRHWSAVHRRLCTHWPYCPFCLFFLDQR